MHPSRYDLAGSTALSKAFHWDSRVALEATARAGFGRCQLFLNPGLGADPATQEALVAQARDLGLALTCHAPVNVDGRDFAPWMFEGFGRLLAREAEKLVIVHVDDRVPRDRALDAVRQLNAHGFVAAVENWYPDPAPGRGEPASRYWLDLLEACDAGGLRTVPVFDFPRLFHQALGTTGALDLSLVLLDRIARAGWPLVLHLIDTRDATQAEATWCPLGAGVVPYRALLGRIEERQIRVHHAVLEYTDEAHLAPSRAFLAAF